MFSECIREVDLLDSTVPAEFYIADRGYHRTILMVEIRGQIVGLSATYLV